MQRNTSPVPFSSSPAVYDPDWFNVVTQSQPLIPSFGQNLGQGNTLINSLSRISPGNIGQRIGDWSRNSGFIGTRDPVSGQMSQGWGGLALGAGQALMNGLMGMRQYGLARRQFEFQKNAWNQNMANQRKTINTQMEDRQRARVAANPTAYQSVGEYMNQNRL